MGLGGTAGIGGFAGGLASGMEMGQQRAMRKMQLQAMQDERQQQGGIWRGLQQLDNTPGGFGGMIPQQPAQLPQIPNPQQPAMQLPEVPNATAQMDAPLAFARRAMAEGYPPAAAAGMAGSLSGESGRNLDPYALNPKSGALGRAQWMGPRKEALLQQPDPYSADTQDRFLFDELRGPEAKTGQALKTATDPIQAEETFTRGFERPGNVDTTPRQRVALAVYQKIAGPNAPPLSPEHTESSMQAANALQWKIPPAMAGQISLSQMIQAVEKSSPGLSDEAKAGVLFGMQKFLEPQQKMLLEQQNEAYRRQWEIFKFGVGEQDKATARAEHEREFELRQAETQANREATQEYRKESLDLRRSQQEAGHGADWSIVQKPDGTTARVNRATGEMAPVELPAGTTKLGAKPPEAAATANPSEVKYWANVLKSGGHLPPGLGRTKAGAALVQEIMKEMATGGDPGDFIANAATVKADERSLTNMTKMTDAAVAFEATASKNFDTALRLSKDAVPTDWGPWLNKWIMTGETQFGDENVPPYVTAMLTGANEYAKIMSGSTGAQGSTVDSRREAAELFSPYLSAGQIDRVVAIAKTDMANRKQALYGQIDDITKRLHSAGSGEPSATKGQGKEAPGAQQGGESMPVPPAFANDPDGTGYKRGNDVWVKKGDKLVKTPGATETK